jgi:hypothetical protein
VARDTRLLAAAAVVVAALAGCGGREDAAPTLPLAVDVDLPRAQRTAATFVDTAVARNDVAASWAVTHPALRSGYTRRAWAAGTIPVQPVPGAHAAPSAFRLIEAEEQELVFAVRLRGRRYLVTERRVDGARWAVSGFAAAIAP